MDKKWIQGAINKPGSLRKELGVKEGKNIPAKKLAEAAKKPGKEGKRARLAQTLKKIHPKKDKNGMSHVSEKRIKDHAAKKK